MLTKMKRNELFITALYSGYCPIAPGTAGTLVGMGIYVFEFLLFGKSSFIINIILTLVLLYPAIKASTAGEKFFSKKDPHQVVIDEVIGYWVSVMFFPFNWMIATLAFFIFRFFDILKPFPLNRLQKIDGGLGIMIDDIIAGLYTAVVLFLIVVVSQYINMPVYG